jgi:heterogeneous nuclear ribonucleoprotein L
LGSGGTGFPFVASPEFTPTNGTVPVPSVPGTPTTPAITAESWKTASTGPQSLMKEPPIAVANRNATTQFATQGQQQAAVMMVYGLDNATANTDKLFNLVCLYGKLDIVGKADNCLQSALPTHPKVHGKFFTFSLSPPPAGNVARIKFLKTKEGTAMVQMGEPVAVERCVQHLNNIPLGSNGKLQIA